MSETTYKMLGLAIMVVSVFLILFGLYIPEDVPSLLGPVLAWGGAFALLGGLILYVVVRKR